MSKKAKKKTPEKISITFSNLSISKVQDLLDGANSSGPYSAGPCMIKHIENPDSLPEKVKEKIIDISYDAIFHFNNPSEKLQLLAIEIAPEVITELKNPSERALKKAIQEQPDLVTEIENPSEDLILLALEHSSGGMMENIIQDLKAKSITKKIMMKAIESDSEAICWFNNPPEEVKRLHIKIWGNSDVFAKRRYVLASY